MRASTRRQISRRSDGTRHHAVALSALTKPPAMAPRARWRSARGRCRRSRRVARGGWRGAFCLPRSASSCSWGPRPTCSCGARSATSSARSGSISRSSSPRPCSRPPRAARRRRCCWSATTNARRRRTTPRGPSCRTPTRCCSCGSTRASRRSRCSRSRASCASRSRRRPGKRSRIASTPRTRTATRTAVAPRVASS